VDGWWLDRKLGAAPAAVLFLPLFILRAALTSHSGPPPRHGDRKLPWRYSKRENGLEPKSFD
jgi:hypothetical protein